MPVSMSGGTLNIPEDDMMPVHFSWMKKHKYGDEFKPLEGQDGQCAILELNVRQWGSTEIPNGHDSITVQVKMGNAVVSSSQHFACRRVTVAYTDCVS